MGNRLIIPAVSDLFPPSSSSPPPFSFYNRCKIRRIGDVLKRAWEILYFLSWDFIIAREVSFEELPKIKKYMKRRSFTCIISSIPCHEREKRERWKKKIADRQKNHLNENICITPPKTSPPSLAHKGTKVVSWWWTIGVARFASISPRFISNFRELAPAWLSPAAEIEGNRRRKGVAWRGGEAPPKVGWRPAVGRGGEEKVGGGK